MPSAKLTEITEDEWDATMATNVKGTFLGCKYAIPLIARAGGGSVINIGSANCYAGEHEHTAYVTSKGAQLLLTKNAAAEYAPERVRVNIICPGAVATPLLDEYIVAMGGLDEANKEFAKYQPLGGLIPAEAVADAAVFLASEQSKWITGASILIDAGLLASWDHPLVED
jgi:dihydroanticapsin dehydrogenase